MNLLRLAGMCLMATTYTSTIKAEIGPLGKDVPFRVKLTADLTSSQNRKGDKISAIVIAPELYKGAVLEGQVDVAKSSGKLNKQSTLRFAFSTLILANGDSAEISSIVQSYRNSKGKEGVDEEGNLIEKRNNVGKAAAITAIGTAIGAAAGGKKGAGVGAAAGFVGALIFVSVGSKAPSIAFAAGSELDMLVTDRRSR